jgi:Protein of unknown function (DUF3604)
MAVTRILFTSALALTLAACSRGDGGSRRGADQSTTGASSDAQGGRPTRAYFGDTHVHTGWSADAGMDGAVTGPEDAFRLARGDEIKSNTGQTVKLNRPLDWMVITDHSDAMGTINEVVAGNPEMLADSVMARWSADLRSGDEERANRAKLDLISMQANKTLPRVIMDPKWMVSAWQKTIAAAEQYNEPGKFTAMIGYEWTVNAGGGDNLHRNVIYRDGPDLAKTMLPLTTFQTQDPEGLWQWMADYETKTGGRLLAIPHNGNLSNGRMFEERRFDGRPLTREYSEARSTWEPLFETTQIKGQSEVHPEFSPNDEFAAYDLWDQTNLNGVPKKPGMRRTEYWREALKAGLRLQGTIGANPFKYGANGATDTHTGLATAEEDNFWGKFKTLEPKAERWNVPVMRGKRGWAQASAGYMGVWATANTRAALWDAMKRRETFSTTGTRLTVRFFAGYDFTAADARGDIAATGYATGVPMGADLRTAPAGRAPTFLLAALKDPSGANLDRIQIVKGWVDAAGKTQERIYNVVWSGDRQPGASGRLPAVGNTVNLTNATYTNTIGAPQLVGFFTDPAFDPQLRAFYYARVLEIPTPRWVLYDKVRFRITDLPRDVPLVHQERAVTSPIWYTPGP